MLATQTMSGMKKDERDRMFNADHKLFFKPADTELKAFAEIAAVTTRQRPDDWINKLSGLKKGECYSVGPSLNLVTNKIATLAQKITISSLDQR
jgi:DNA phosphorothioation-dependent restriction protein DptH